MNAGLLASQELSHDFLQIQRQESEGKRTGVGCKKRGMKDDDVDRSGEILPHAGDRSAPLIGYV